MTNVDSIFPDVIAIININTSCQAVIGQFFWLFVVTFIKILTFLEVNNLLRPLRPSAEEITFVVFFETI